MTILDLDIPPSVRFGAKCMHLFRDNAVLICLFSDVCPQCDVQGCYK